MHAQAARSTKVEIYVEGGKEMTDVLLLLCPPLAQIAPSDLMISYLQAQRHFGLIVLEVILSNSTNVHASLVPKRSGESVASIDTL